MASLDEYNFTTISDRVMHQIRSDILNGEFKAGQKLILSDLKDRYNVGGSPLREAMVQLSWQKYVTMKPQKGFWVADVSLNELKSIIKARLAIGNVALRDAMDNGDEKWELNILVVTPIDLLMVKFTFYKRSNNLIVHLFAFRKT
ncbi:GntR family transcriptional regulator, partial [Photobacterium damselae subsp. piscicida]